MQNRKAHVRTFQTETSTHTYRRERMQAHTHAHAHTWPCTRTHAHGCYASVEYISATLREAYSTAWCFGVREERSTRRSSQGTTRGNAVGSNGGFCTWPLSSHT